MKITPILFFLHFYLFIYYIFLVREMNLSVAVLTSVVKSCRCAHPPLALVHARRHGALHLHANVSHFLRVQRPHHHQVYMAKLIASHILQANPWRPRLCA